MRKITFTRSFAAPLAAAVLLGAVLLPATAREGSSSRSVGHGVKCYTVAVKNPDGTVTYTQVCRKGV
jgi:ABC-type sugar transport system substrate-binding protein